MLLTEVCTPSPKVFAHVLAMASTLSETHNYSYRAHWVTVVLTQVLSHRSHFMAVCISLYHTSFSVVLTRIHTLLLCTYLPDCDAAAKCLCCQRWQTVELPVLLLAQVGHWGFEHVTIRLQGMHSWPVNYSSGPLHPVLSRVVGGRISVTSFN